MVIEISNSTIPARQPVSANNEGNLKLVAADNTGTARAAETVEEAREVKPEATLSDLKKSVSQLNDLVQSIQRDLQFSLDDVSGRTVITVFDSQTEEVIRQIPSEEVLAIAKNIESLKGILFSAEV